MRDKWEELDTLVAHEIDLSLSDSAADNEDEGEAMIHNLHKVLLYQTVPFHDTSFHLFSMLEGLWSEVIRPTELLPFGPFLH